MNIEQYKNYLRTKIEDCPVIEGLTPEVAHHVVQERERILKLL